MPTEAEYRANREQFSLEDYTTATPEGDVRAVSYNPGYLPDLLDLRAAVQAGRATDLERQRYAQMVQTAQAIPMRDVRQLQFDAGEGDRAQALWGGAPDLGAIMLSLADRIDAGQATDQERALFQTTNAALRNQSWRASVPQPSDAFNPLGDQFFGALGTLALGATGGLAAAPLAAGGASLATTLGSLGTLSGIAGTGAGVLGQALDQPWLSRAGTVLSGLGGIAGGVGGLANLWGTGVQSLSDAARLASSAGKITGAIGSASGNDALRQASRYLGQAGQLGQVGSGLLPTSFTDWSGDSAPWAANLAPGVSGVSNLLSAADGATQRGGGDMADFSYEDFIGWGDPNQGDPWNFPLPADTPGWEDFTGWGGDETQQPWYQGADLDTSGQGGLGWLSSTLGSLGGLGKTILGGGGGGSAGGLASWLGPLLSAAGGLGAGAIGSNASNEAARLQAAALNRGIDLSTSQWLAQLSRTAPWVQAGQQALGTLQGLAGQQGPPPPGAAAAIDPRAYGMPNATPGWQQRAYQGPQAPHAADYRYSAPATVDLAQHAWNAPQAMDPAQYAFNTPGGQELLAKDPGYAFRQEEARKALEASALARGTGMSGATLQALQARSQDIASAEYQNAYARALGENQLRYGRGLTQTQEDYQRQLAANQLRYGRASEQQQLGYQQGLGAQGFNWQTALQGQQNAFNQGLTADQYLLGQQQKTADDYYQRVMDQYKTTMGLDIAQNQTNYERQQQLYKQQLAQHLLPWDQQATLAQLGGQMTGQLGGQGIQATSGIANLLGQLGTAQAGGTTGGANAWMNALQNVGGAASGYLNNQSYLQGLQSILSGLNR